MARKKRENAAEEEQKKKIKVEIVKNCQRLCSEFQQYVIQSKCLRKVFLSIKGIYYQVEIKGQTITWLTPYQFSQRVSFYYYYYY